MLYEERVKKAAHAIGNSEFVLIGGGAGPSDAAGLQYSHLQKI